ncbi:MAG TPA: Tat pathway signal sequence [Candidatus Olsenella excrementigallinarum]|nr:Tat pathway signal sequence [Candidatus Olsenella excrementigallinarum]
MTSQGPSLKDLFDRLGRQGAPGNAPRPGSSFVDRLATWSRRALVLLAVVAVVALVAAYWWFHPALNVQSPMVCTWIVGICLLGLLALAVAAARRPLRAKAYRRMMIVPVAPIAAIVIGGVLSLPLIPGNAERYASVLETTDGVFAEDIEEVDYSEVPVIDRDSAILLGNRAMGSIPEYVSQFEIADTYSMINYQGRPVRVSPLVYADLFKWLSNRDSGIPAYVLVDMVTQEAEVVRLEQPIRYSDSEPLARNVDRHVQLSYPDLMFDQKSFELDEEGHPWWVYPVQRRTIGLFGGTDIYGVVLVDACTGETDFYAVEDCPTWVDRAYPSDLLIEQYNWSGMYENGWLNSWLGQEGVVRTTPGTNGQLGYNYIAQGEDIYLYTGVTSVTADDSSVGFILVNQRTGESHFYPVAGATEASAMASAEGQLQNLRYQATYPILLNVAGQPTYFVSLKDDAGLVKMFAMINIEQYQSVATGSTVEECQEAYLALLASDGLLSEEEAAESSATQEVSGQIATIAQAVVDGNSHFYVTLAGDATGTIYDFALPELLEIVAYQPGDQIAFRCVEKSEEAATVTVSDLL